VSTHSSELKFYGLDTESFGGQTVPINETKQNGSIPDDGAGWDYKHLRSKWKDVQHTSVTLDDIRIHSRIANQVKPPLFLDSSCQLLLVPTETSVPEVRDPKHPDSKICSLMTSLPSPFPQLQECGNLYEFIVISRDLTVFQPSLCIMLTLQDERGIRYRQTVAQIDEHAWIALEDRIWKLVILG